MTMNFEAFVHHLDDCPWESRAEDPTRTDVIRWKQMVSTDRAPSEDISMGLLEFPTRAKLRLHRHTPAEIYYIQAGRGELRIRDAIQPVCAGAFAFIPSDRPHAIANVGPDPLRLFWIFPTDSGREVDYIYLE